MTWPFDSILKTKKLLDSDFAVIFNQLDISFSTNDEALLICDDIAIDKDNTFKVISQVE